MRLIWRWLCHLWCIVRRSYDALIPLRITVLVVALVAAAFGFSDQGQDAIRLVGETDTTMVQITFGVSAFILALAVWYWSRQLLLIRKAGARPPTRWIREWVPRILGAAVFVCMAAVMLKAGAQYGSGAAPTALWVFAVIFVLAGPVFLVLAFRRRDWLNLPSGQTVARFRDLPATTQRMLMFAAALAFVLFIAATWYPQNLVLLGAPTILLLSASLWVVLGSVIVHVGNILRIPIITSLVVLAFAFSKCNDNHVIRPMEVRKPVPKRLNVCDRFDSWKAQLEERCRGQHERHPVFIVVTEGGGIRAAYWTAAVLSALHDQRSGFSDHVFAISGVSGGSLGTTIYASLLATPSLKGEPIRPQARLALMRDALAPTLAATLQPDLAQRFLPFPALSDRAEALEVAWEYGWEYRGDLEKSRSEQLRLMLGSAKRAPVTLKLSDGFLSTFVNNDRLFPSLFLNGTVVETGDRAITSNVAIDNRFARALDTMSAVGHDVKISTGSNFSSRFPFVSPAATIRNRTFGIDTARDKCERCETT